jgi:hypothetical protein
MKHVIRLGVLAILVLFGTSRTLEADCCHLTSMRTQDYYTDSAFTNLVGSETTYCDLSYSSWGTLFTQYKVLRRDACDGSQTYSETCWQSNGSGGYTQIACPF